MSVAPETTSHHPPQAAVGAKVKDNDMMTTRQAIEICRQEAAKNTGEIRQALTLIADVAQHHAERNRRNKQRQRAKARAA